MPVHKYKTKSGIKIVIAKTNGPLVNGYLCLGKVNIIKIEDFEGNSNSQIFRNQSISQYVRNYTVRELTINLNLMENSLTIKCLRFFLVLTIATKAHDENGIPHILEHLVFLGNNCKTLSFLQNKIFFFLNRKRRLPVQGSIGFNCKSLLRIRNERFY